LLLGGYSEKRKNDIIIRAIISNLFTVTSRIEKTYIGDDFIVEEDYCMEKIFLEREAKAKNYDFPVV
jgi:hypothetical protein